MLGSERSYGETIETENQQFRALRKNRPAPQKEQQKTENKLSETAVILITRCELKRMSL